MEIDYEPTITNEDLKKWKDSKDLKGLLEINCRLSYVPPAFTNLLCSVLTDYLQKQLLTNKFWN